jgi:hypothetical protein
MGTAVSAWDWLLDIVWRGLDVLVHLWQIDREMREGKWDEDDEAEDADGARPRRRRRRRRFLRRRGAR